MPEHFGIKDLFVVLKKYMFLILTFMLIFLAFFGFRTYKSLQAFKESKHTGKSLYTSSISYYVKPNLSNINSEQIVSSDFYYSLPGDYVSLLNTDACANYIQNGLLKQYSKEFLKENSEITLSKNSENVDSESIKKVYMILRDKQSMVFNVYALAYDKELSEFILGLCNEYLDTQIKSKVQHSDLEGSEKTVRIIKSVAEIDSSAELKDSNTSSESTLKYTVKSVIKSTIVPTVALTLILVLFLVLKAFFNPTLNRKSDFAEYDILILGEIKNK